MKHRLELTKEETKKAIVRGLEKMGEHPPMDAEVTIQNERNAVIEWDDKPVPF